MSPKTATIYQLCYPYHLFLWRIFLSLFKWQKRRRFYFSAQTLRPSLVICAMLTGCRVLMLLFTRNYVNEECAFLCDYFYWNADFYALPIKRHLRGEMAVLINRSSECAMHSNSKWGSLKLYLACTRVWCGQRLVKLLLYLFNTILLPIHRTR